MITTLVERFPNGHEIHAGTAPVDTEIDGFRSTGHDFDQLGDTEQLRRFQLRYFITVPESDEIRGRITDPANETGIIGELIDIARDGGVLEDDTTITPAELATAELLGATWCETARFAYEQADHDGVRPSRIDAMIVGAESSIPGETFTNYAFHTDPHTEAGHNTIRPATVASNQYIAVKSVGPAATHYGSNGVQWLEEFTLRTAPIQVMNVSGVVALSGGDKPVTHTTTNSLLYLPQECTSWTGSVHTADEHNIMRFSAETGVHRANFSRPADLRVNTSVTTTPRIPE